MKKLLIEKCCFYVVIAAIFATSCTESEDNMIQESNIEEDVTISEAEAEITFDEVDYEIQRINNITDNGRITAGNGERTEDPCAQVTRDRETRITTINFGTENCEGLDGKMRRGKIIIVHTGTFREQNATFSTTFENFFVNDRGVEGTRIISNKGTDEDGYLVQEITLEGGKITFLDGTMFTRDASWTRTWIRGNNPSEDVYSHFGNATGTTRKGYDYTVIIEENNAVMKKRACAKDRVRIPVAGIKTITATKEDVTHTREVDFGSGECDNSINVTINGNSINEVIIGD